MNDDYFSSLKKDKEKLYFFWDLILKNHLNVFNQQDNDFIANKNNIVNNHPINRNMDPYLFIVNVFDGLINHHINKKLNTYILSKKSMQKVK